MRLRTLIALAVSAALAACATTATDDAEDEGPEPYASTYQPRPSVPTLIRGATVFDGNGAELANADVLMADGRITAVGQNLSAPAGATVIDASGRFVTPGIIDAHSHLGVYPSPSIQATSDGNEITQPNTAEVWAEHSVWPQDPGFFRAVAGGITTLHVLPGSANLFGGRGVTLRPVLGARTVQEMKFPGAPQSLKMACGENPARAYGSRNQSPASGMGNVAGYRQAWINAERYARRMREAEEGQGDPPDRDLELDTLAGVLNGDIILQWHCYRADEMANAIEIAREFDFEIAAFHHAVEAYKIADLLRENEICAAMWADWWGFKIEAYDGIRENIPFVHAAGACAIVHSDSSVGIQRLNQEAAKALADGRRAGLEITRAQAWTWLSRNPARALHIDEETGTLEPGRRADVVIWSADPLSSYAVAQQVFIDGALIYERGAQRDPPSDFELGQSYRETAQ
ncbi:MAG TPA: amidohydrolase [Vitreimonas sp.]|jgi:imidazolonepropionase-like amidohydrolase|nr:amidohydrolase [Vitreimonas sp.]